MSGRASFLEACRRLDAGQDPNLREYFSATNVVEALGQFDRPEALAVGIKGIGKSAAFRYFHEFNPDADVVIGVNPDLYTLHLPNKDLNYATCMKQFECDLVLEALRAIKDRRKALKGKVPEPDLKKAEKEVATYLESLKKWAGRFGGISVLGCGFTLNAQESSVLVGLETDSALTRPRDVLKSICEKGLRIRIVVDDPEQVFSQSRELDAHLVGGFCLAALRLSSLINNLKILVLLKSHVYYPLLRQIDDLGKYPDQAGRLSWNQEELIALVERRMTWSGVRWIEIFQGSEAQARKLVLEMSGELRNGPRDLMRWIYYALQAATGGKITREHVDSSRSRTAVEGLRELDSAFLNEYEGITTVIKTVFGMDPSRSFSLPDLRRHIADLMVTDAEMTQLTHLQWMQRETSQTLPEVFLRVGALSLESRGSLILPYQAEYDEEHLELAQAVRLVPMIATGIG